MFVDTRKRVHFYRRHGKLFVNTFQELCQVGSGNIEHYTSTLQSEDGNSFAAISIFAIAKEKRVEVQANLKSTKDT